MTSFSLLVKFAIAMVGYVAAVIAAVAVTLFLILLPTALPDNGAWGSFYAYTRDLPVVVYGGLVITFVAAFPGFLVTLGLAALAKWQTWLPFTIAGGADALLSHSLVDIQMGSFMPPSYIAASVPGGLAGGFIYWAFAGRFLASHRELAAA